MKKFKGLLVLLILFVITGCSLGNSPKSKVEALLMKYQTNSSDLKTELDDFKIEDNVEEGMIREDIIIEPIETEKVEEAIAKKEVKRFGKVISVSKFSIVV